MPHKEINPVNYGQVTSASDTNHAPSMQVEKGGVMFGSTKEGLIFALEAQTGKVLWKHKIGNSLINTVVPLNGQQVLFTATSGEVGLLRVKN